MVRKKIFLDKTPSPIPFDILNKKIKMYKTIINFSNNNWFFVILIKINRPIWEKEPSKFDYEYDSEETCLIIDGEATVTI